MTFAEARAGGFVRGNESASRSCSSYDLHFRGERLGLVFISPDRGVEMIWPQRRVRTPEGVTIGTPAAQVAAAYPDFRPDLLAEIGHFTVRVPGNPNAHYRLGFYDRLSVSDIILSRFDQHCAG
jgi:hypothetical protein